MRVRLLDRIPLNWKVVTGSVVIQIVAQLLVEPVAIIVIQHEVAIDVIITNVSVPVFVNIVLLWVVLLGAIIAFAATGRYCRYALGYFEGFEQWSWIRLNAHGSD